MRLDPLVLERRLSEELGVHCVLAASEEPEPLSSLDCGERRRLATFGTSARADAYRRGRAALRALFARVGENPAGAKINFPHRRFSLTHAAGVAIALSAGAGAGEGDSGAGIDFEPPRAMTSAAERFYLRPDERRWLGGLDSARASRERLRLWTVKEALFKANLRNAGTFLGDYATEDPSAASGRAASEPSRSWTEAWRYATLETAGGYLLTAAVGVSRRHP